MMLEVINYEPFYKGKIIGYVDVKIIPWKIIFRNIAHLQSGEKKWFNFPTRTKETSEGNNKYIPAIEFEINNHTIEFFELLGKAVKEFCEKNKISEPAPLSFNEEFPF